MTGRRASILVLLALGVAALPAAIVVRRLTLAQDDFRAAKVTFAQTVRDAQEIIDLRGKRQTVESRQRPTQDVIAQVNSVLGEVGIPGQGHFKSLTPESEGSAGSEGPVAGEPGGLLQQSLRLVLEDLAPDQLGALLVQWRSAQQVWTPTRLELVHNRAAASDAGVTGNRYDTSIVLTALYVAGGGAGAGAGAGPSNSTASTGGKEHP